MFKSWLWIALIAVAAVFLIGYVVYDSMFLKEASVLPRPPAEVSEVSAPAVPEPEEAELANQVRVAAVTGVARYGGKDDQWEEVRAGIKLPADAKVQTEEGASVDLELGKDITVAIGANSELSVPEMTKTLSRLVVDEGRVSAQVPEGSAKLRVEFVGNETVAETTEGSFSALSMQDQVAVATTSGQVKLRAKGGSVIVGAGQQSVVVGDKPPSEPQQIPKSFFLKVGAPGERVQRTKETTIRGEAAPGSIVAVNGVQGTTGPDGTFSVKIPLEQGRNPITVVAHDALGRTKRQQAGSVKVDTRAPKTKGEVEW